MRIIVFFDLPSTSIAERRTASQFRKFLIRQGFVMLQHSVYIRATQNYDDSQKYISIVSSNIPSVGDVRILKISENQFAKYLLKDIDSDIGIHEMIVI